jgi:hypothetical protein
MFKGRNVLLLNLLSLIKSEVNEMTTICKIEMHGFKISIEAEETQWVQLDPMLKTFLKGRTYELMGDILSLRQLTPLIPEFTKMHDAVLQTKIKMITRIRDEMDKHLGDDFDPKDPLF